MPFRERLHHSVKQFYVRDDMSHTTAGKKTITKCKRKMQKRFVTDSLQDLHRKFLSEFPHMKISYALFCRMRPFWVLLPNLKSRETCLCKLHNNFQFLAEKLLNLHLLQSASLQRIADSCVCDSRIKSCMYGVCEMCKDRSLLFPPNCFNQRVAYHQWVVGTEEKTLRNGTTVSVQLTKKEIIESTVKQLIDKFNELLKKFKKHLFNIRHQFEQYRYAKANLCFNECIIHVDFAENFSCKYSSEIQSVHFGSSHRQATLHNGVFFVMKEQSLFDTCFCTISDCKKHEPIAIWLYMDPILKLIRQRNPQIDTGAFL